MERVNVCSGVKQAMGVSDPDTQGVLKRLPCCSEHTLVSAETLRKAPFFLKSDTEDVA